jgi:hypothetical protein
VLVEQLRFRVRLAFDLRCLRASGYGFAAGELDTVGRKVGGGKWPVRSIDRERL